MVFKDPKHSFRPSRVAGLLLLALALTACAPVIRSFSVLPHHVCDGTLVTAAWDADGNAKLTTAPPLSPLGGSGLVYATPPTDTVFTLTASRWPHKPKVSQTEVTVMAPRDQSAASDDLPFRMSCEGEQLSSTLDRPIKAWDSHLIVRLLSTDGSRDLVLRHEGRDVLITSQAGRSAAFRGTHLGGQWTLSATLLPSERCGDPQKPPPDLITVTVEVSCTR